MGLFSKKSSSSSQPPGRPVSSSNAGRAYAPPSGPPPPTNYGGGGYQQQQQQSPYGGQGYQPSQGYQQQPPQGYYAPPPGAPPQQYQQGGGGYAPPPGPPPPQSTQPSAGIENQLAQLSRFDTAFLIDDSESMEMFWDEVSNALAGVVDQAVRYDKDGIDFYFFNSTVVKTSQSAQELMQLFRRVEPRKSTPTANALRRVLDPYVGRLEAAKAQPGGMRNIKPLNLIILTDGAPDRGQDPEEYIVSIARRLDAIKAPPFQLGLQFVQIGVDEEAEDALRKLDDDLKTKHGVRDIVDTTLWSPAYNNGVVDANYLTKALLGGINKAIDAKDTIV